MGECTQSIQDTSSAIKDCIKAYAENAPTDKSKIPDWVQETNNQWNECDKWEFFYTIHGMTSEMMHKVESYAPDDGASAAAAWQRGMTIVMQALSKIIIVFGEAVDAVVSFVPDANQKVDDAFNSAKNWCEGAEKDIGHFIVMLTTRRHASP